MIIDAKARFLARRAEAIYRQVRFLRDRIEVTGALFMKPSESDIYFAIRELPSIISKAFRVKRVPRDAAGRIDPRWIMPVFNLIGDIYPLLPLIYRDQFLRCVLGYLDRLDEDHAKRHVHLLRKPLLIGDIVINRRKYWPGLDQRALFIGGRPMLTRLSDQKPELVNTFWGCAAVIANGDYLTDQDRREYYLDYPVIVDDTLDFVAALGYDLAYHHSLVKGTRLEKNLPIILRKHFDPSLLGRILERIAKRPWLTL